jgi:hypothetical protein
MRRKLEIEPPPPYWCDNPERVTAFVHTTLGRTPLDGWWARRRDLYFETHNTHKKYTRTSKSPMVLEAVIPASEGPKLPALYRGTTWIGVTHH